MSQQGFMGALAGAGKAASDVGGFMMRDTMQRRQQEETSERENRREEMRFRRNRTAEQEDYTRNLTDKRADMKQSHQWDMEKIRAQNKATGAGRAPAEIQTIEWAASNLFNGDKNKAAEWAKNARMNPQETALKYAREASRQQKEAMMDSSDPDYKSFDALYTEALSAIKASSATNSGAGGKRGAPKAGDVVDGYRFKGGNTKDPNSWEAVK